MALPWWLWISVINLALVLSTAVHHKLVLTPRIHFFLRQIDLAIEMNFAAWWSGVLLLLLGLLACEIASDRFERNRLAWGMLAIAWLCLSLDEIGSIHERIEDWMPEAWLPVVDPYVPIALVGLLLLPYPLLRLFRRSRTRKTATLLLVGFLCLASIAVQERLEGYIDWGDWWPLRLAMEEGSELLGMFICYCGLVNHTWRDGHARGLSGVLPNPLRMKGLPVVLGGGLAVQGAIALALIFTQSAPFSEHTLVWYPLAVGLLIALTALWRYKRSPDRISDDWKIRLKSKGWLLLSAYFLTYSAVVPYVIPLTTNKADAFLSEHLYLFYVLQLAIVVCLFGLFRDLFIYWAAAEQRSNRHLPNRAKLYPYAVLLLLSGLVVLSGKFSQSMAVRYMLPGGFTLLCYWLFFWRTWIEQKNLKGRSRQKPTAYYFHESSFNN